MSNLFGGDAGTAKAPDAKAEPADSSFLQDLFGEADEADGGAEQPTEPALLENGQFLADDEVGSIIASMTDLATDLDSPFA